MLDTLVDLLARSDRVAVLTGAGISAESGVPTFRGADGIWKKFRAEELATMGAFMANPKLVWEWYNWRRTLMAKVQPNPGHFALVELEKMIPEFTLITQNVDNLHRLAGSTNPLELHGNIHRNKCVNCETQVSQEIEIDPDNILRCPRCGGRIRPDVVWFGEMLPARTIQRAFEAAENCQVFLSVGTSAIVHPAASLPITASGSGATLVEINPDRTPLTDVADMYFGQKSGEFLPKVAAALRERRGPKG